MTLSFQVINKVAEIDWDSKIYMAIILVPLILICQIRVLKFLVPFSMVANILMGTDCIHLDAWTCPCNNNRFPILVAGVSIIITLYYIFEDVKELGDNVGDRNLVSDISSLPLFFSTVIFAMEGIGVVMPVENTMQKPWHFLGCPGVLNTAMCTVVTLYAIVGFFGYLKYGDGTQGSITGNLRVEEM